MSKEKKKVECPCCKLLKGQHEMRVLIYQLNTSKRLTFRDEEVSVDFDFVCAIAESSRKKWACDKCVKSGKAIVSNHTKMNFSVMPRYYAYFDEKKHCYKCKKDYIFSLREQQYWFETLSFWHEAHPSECPTCRKSIRYQKNLVKELSNLLKNLDEENPDQLKRIAEIYKEMGNTEKEKHYNTLTIKRLRQLKLSKRNN